MFECTAPGCRNGTVRHNLTGSYSETSSEHAARSSGSAVSSVAFSPRSAKQQRPFQRLLRLTFQEGWREAAAQQGRSTSGAHKATAVGRRCLQRGRKLQPPSRAQHQGGLSVLAAGNGVISSNARLLFNLPASVFSATARCSLEAWTHVSGRGGAARVQSSSCSTVRVAGCRLTSPVLLHLSTGQPSDRM